jgi:ferredoxin
VTALLFCGADEVAMGKQTKLRVRIDRERCQGHARCFALAPELFELDEMGNGRERGDGAVAPGLEDKAHLAQANCPELAVEVVEDEKP